MRLLRPVMLIPLILVMILDLIFTMMGQPDCYWQDYSLVQESNPIGDLLLSMGPMYFIISFVVYFFLILSLIVTLPKPLNLTLTIAVFLGHTWGSASWLAQLYPMFFAKKINEWYLYMGYFILIAIISGFCSLSVNKKSLK